MKCPDNGMLRAYVDGELAAAERNGVEEHLSFCASCERQLQTIARGTEEVERLLQATAAGPIVDARVAFDRYGETFGSRLEGKADRTKRLLRLPNRPVWGGVAAAAALIVLLSFSPAKTWGQKVLQMLRVQKLAVVPVNLSALTQAHGREPGHLISQLMSDNVVVTMDPGKPANAASADLASQMAGFKVRTLDGAGSLTDIRVTNEGAFHMRLDRDRMQAILDQAGRSDIQIPESVDGSTVAVHIPKLVRLQYGNCGERTSAGDESCMNFVQVPSPTVSVPPNLDISALAEAGLQLAGMSAGEAHSFTKTVDWSSTLVIPVPQSGGSYRSVAVDSVNGTLIEVPPQGSLRGNYSLIWLKNGIIYSLDGRGSSSQALAAVASLG